TSGHVDHGKTCLIKALSGFDTDRLKEEKKRGITIDLGFANLPNDAGLHIGIIDVPGHEKFVKNMLAGIGGIDLVLLVVALDEGVMPQTIEHFEIIKMLSIKRGIVVLTKSDLVDDEWADIVEEDVKKLVKGSFLENAPFIRVSSYTSKNIAKLNEMIINMVSDIGDRKNDPELFRLPIDRVFTMEGFGTVITGTLQEGSVSLGDEIMLYPKEKLLKIRGIQSHGQKEEKAFAGQRVALNLLNIRKEELERGDILAYKNSIIKTKLIDVWIELFSTSSRELKNGDRVHLNYGSKQTIAKVVLLSKSSLKAKEGDYAQLRFDEEVCIKRNDRFIVRFLSPVESFGGGRVIDTIPLKHKRMDEAVLKVCEEKASADIEKIAAIKIKEESHKYYNRQDYASILNVSSIELKQILDKLLEDRLIIELSDASLIHIDYFNRVSEYSKELLDEFHKEKPITEGMDKEEFKSRLTEKFRLTDPKKSALLLAEMVRRKILKTRDKYVSNSGFIVSYSKELSGMQETIRQKYIKAGIEAPATNDVVADIKDSKKARQIIEDMHKSGELIKISPAAYMYSEAYEKVLESIKTLAGQSEDNTFSLAEFRDAHATSRKYAMAVLEYLDKKKITKLVGDRRVLL
ncbi:MAG: selenocysteine-specific translation elongation factor, partial [Lachnoanaerobaculum gingivalis]